MLPGSVVRKGGYLYEALVNILPVENVEPEIPTTTQVTNGNLLQVLLGKVNGLNLKVQAQIVHSSNIIQAKL